MTSVRLKERTASIDSVLDLLRCPATGDVLYREGGGLRAANGPSYNVSEGGIPLFAEQICSAEARIQRQHYDKVAAAYVANLAYPHTQEYMAYLDGVLKHAIDEPPGTAAELCCGRGEAFALLKASVVRGIGVDISLRMLDHAAEVHSDAPIAFIQGDATMLPLADRSFDSVFMLGGVHHVSNRRALFREVARILKPGGRFYFREPVSDFFLWRAIRHVVYRMSPALDHETEAPLRYGDTAPLLSEAGLDLMRWTTHGFLGFCLFMNSDVLVFNRLFRFVPGIRSVTRVSARLDEAILRFPGLGHSGLQVVGVATKPC